MPSTSATPVESAKFLRVALRSAFPAVKFSVTLSRGTAWGNCHVTWTDGPTRAEVSAVADKFEGKSFDGMDDSTHYLTKMLPNGLESGLGYVICQRSVA